MFHYFGYGSNINLTSLRAKGVDPLKSERAVLHGWKLAFNVKHWFRHEGGMGNILPAENNMNQVQGMLHLCEDEHLSSLDAVEAYGQGYDRIEIEVETENGLVKATTYVGMPGYLDNALLPTRRYLSIILKGAQEAGLDEAYIEKLKQQPLFPVPDYPPFRHPESSERVFNQETLEQHPNYTALAGAVFDMQGARNELNCLQALFGGKDMTLFHLKRHDTSDGSETLDDIKNDRISEPGRQYLNAYLHEYDHEYHYVGHFSYD